jgi:hypothetical protein
MLIVNWSWTSFRDIRPEGRAAKGDHNILATRISGGGAVNGVLILFHARERENSIHTISMHRAL